MRWYKHLFGPQSMRQDTARMQTHLFDQFDHPAQNSTGRNAHSGTEKLFCSPTQTDAGKRKCGVLSTFSNVTAPT
jgi:hypothetical protein